jgi:hypothetical protein
VMYLPAHWIKMALDDQIFFMLARTASSECPSESRNSALGGLNSRGSVQTLCTVTEHKGSNHEDPSC